MNVTLILIWGFIISFGVIMYVILDGFDLGIGILFPWIANKEFRDIMMNSVAPLWDGNETWLVLGGAILYGAFPLAYSTLLPILYLPLMVMLGALIFRGVAFEFRFKAHRSQFLWDIAFSVGSMLAAFCQGLILGTFVLGYSSNPDLLFGNYVWLSPFSFITGIGVVIGYALLGSTWLIIKTQNELQNVMYHVAKILLVIITIFIFIVSVWTPFLNDAYLFRWFSVPNFYYLMPLPILTALAIVIGMYGLFKRYEKIPFIMSVLLFIFSYIGLCISVWPYMVPRSITVWQAASNSKSLLFMLVGTVILLPLLLAYSIYAYYVFKGKVSATHGYHE